MYSKCSKISNTFLSLFSNKMLVFWAGIHKMLARSFFRSSLVLHCFSKPFWKVTCVQNFRRYTISHVSYLRHTITQDVSVYIKEHISYHSRCISCKSKHISTIQDVSHVYQSTCLPFKMYLMYIKAHIYHSRCISCKSKHIFYHSRCISCISKHMSTIQDVSHVYQSTYLPFKMYLK